MKKLEDFLTARRIIGTLPEDIKNVIKEIDNKDVVIDVGANIGDITSLFDARGAKVIAIEPNPHAYQILEERFKGRERVTTIHGAAIGDDAPVVKLFLHKQSEEDPIVYSSGSSLMQSKPNVGTSFFEVRGVNLSKLIEKAGEVSILKIDIEGYEVELLPTILSSGCLKFVKNVFVETHDKKWPDLHEKTSLMKSLCSQANHTNFFWNWP